MDLVTTLAALVALLSGSANSAAPVSEAATSSASPQTAASQAPVLNVSSSTLVAGNIAVSN